MTLWRTFRAVLLAPFTVTIAVPAVIALTSGIHPLSDLPGWLTVSSVTRPWDQPASSDAA